MGVEYFPCNGCNGVICDAGDYHTCEHCGRQTFCEECSENLKHIYVCTKCHCQEELCKCENCDIEKFYLCDQCVNGRGPPNNNLIEFLLTKAGFKNRTEAEKAYFTAKNETPTRVVVKNQNGQVKFVDVDRYGPEEDDPSTMY
jgi:hypothetical protein